EGNRLQHHSSPLRVIETTLPVSSLTLRTRYTRRGVRSPAKAINPRFAFHGREKPSVMCQVLSRSAYSTSSRPRFVTDSSESVSRTHFLAPPTASFTSIFRNSCSKPVHIQYSVLTPKRKCQDAPRWSSTAKPNSPKPTIGTRCWRCATASARRCE